VWPGLSLRSPGFRSTCKRVFAVTEGGPAAAIAEALLYMDAYHEGDRLRKIQSGIRSTPAETNS